MIELADKPNPHNLYMDIAHDCKDEAGQAAQGKRKGGKERGQDEADKFPPSFECLERLGHLTDSAYPIPFQERLLFLLAWPTCPMTVQNPAALS